MGQARLRGTQDERRREAIKLQNAPFVEGLGDPEQIDALRAGLKMFMDRLTPEQWRTRRVAVLDYLRGRPQAQELVNAKSIRVQEDEIAWYLFLCEQALEHPGCTDVSQSQRTLPFFAGIGARARHASKVKRLNERVDAVLHDYRKEPDGLLFEILVALSYAEVGWEVEFLPESDKKTPDMLVRLGEQELYVECKRMSRRTEYAEQERNDFLKLWEPVKHLLLSQREWLWFNVAFHVEPSTLPASFLADTIARALPIGISARRILDTPDVTIDARRIDQAAVKRHLEGNYVKQNSPMLSRVIGGDWAPENAEVTLLHAIKVAHLKGCDVPALGAYVDDISFACGMTRQFDSDISIDKKAKDIIKSLSKAVKQVPDDKPSIIHIAAETMEGAAVEMRRTEKLLKLIPEFITGKPVLGVHFHRLQAHQRALKLFEIDETVDKYWTDGISLRAVPKSAVVPAGSPMAGGTHWELYPQR